MSDTQSSTQKKKSSGDYGCLIIVGVLTLILVPLKLLGSIHWSWWWVLSPIWILALFVIVFVALMAAGSRR